ncbi:MAG: cellulase family glycosylhydrolase [Verrucomicrobiota bacterium]
MSGADLQLPVCYTRQHAEDIAPIIFANPARQALCPTIIAWRDEVARREARRWMHRWKDWSYNWPRTTPARCQAPLGSRLLHQAHPMGLMGLSLSFLIFVGVAIAGPPGTSTLPADSTGVLLPAGFPSARGSQIVAPDGTPVRIASVGLTGMNVVGGRLQLAGPFKGVAGHVAAMRAMGFNCVRVDWIDQTLADPGAMAQLDTFVAACKKVGLKVVFDNHNNEATPSDWENAAQQKNGLWFDTGPGTDGTDGAGNKGTVSTAKFQANWVTFARHWAGNSTVIGFDLRNEPCAHTATPALWGGKGPTDIHAMYESVGNAILAVNPDALIICEAVINYKTGAYEGDLSVVRGLPIVLSNPAKLVYSVHEYPKEIGGYRGPESGAGYIARMNNMWGWLITENVAPVWIGEMGASMTSAASKAWGQTLLDYLNGKALGGPTFKGNQQPIGGDWWAWGCLSGQNPNGCVGEDGKVRPEQAPFINQMIFHLASRPD